MKTGEATINSRFIDEEDLSVQTKEIRVFFGEGFGFLFTAAEKTMKK